ncbi:helix-turn-helix domain-containing protein [Vibrio galatheae]|uniref:helix-turn-helix domain-containing protein n=1 Tax=Vibrio galatheae TaxID=579748 RepID=UPI00194E71F4|nr:helix-turn-helix domain-containing protein [Vibrio galatheae]
MLLMVQAMQVSVGNPLRKLVLIKLADNANDYGECWPSYQHIADQCEIGKSTVRKHIKDLEKSGLLQIENRKGPKGNASNIYKLTLTPIAPNSTGVAADSTPPVAADSTGTSHSLEPVKEPKEKSTKKESLDFSPLGFTAEQVNEFKRLRKHAKADITQRVINTIGKQLDLTRQAGYSNDQILDVWVSKSWRSYEHQWFINATQQNGIPSHETNRQTYQSAQSLAIEESKLCRGDKVLLQAIREYGEQVCLEAGYSEADVRRLRKFVDPSGTAGIVVDGNCQVLGD